MNICSSPSSPPSRKARDWAWDWPFQSRSRASSVVCCVPKTRPVAAPSSPSNYRLQGKRKNMFEGLKVLLVEDDPTVREGSEQALQLAGLDVLAFHSAELAYKLLTPGFPGIVVSDVRLPGMSGLEL